MFIDTSLAQHKLKLKFNLRKHIILSFTPYGQIDCKQVSQSFKGQFNKQRCTIKLSYIKLVTPGFILF